MVFYILDSLSPSNIWLNAWILSLLNIKFCLCFPTGGTWVSSLTSFLLGAIASAKADAGWMSVPSYAMLGLEPQGSAPLPVPSLIFVSWDDQYLFSSLSEKRPLEISAVVFSQGRSTCCHWALPDQLGLTAAHFLSVQSKNDANWVSWQVYYLCWSDSVPGCRREAIATALTSKEKLLRDCTDSPLLTCGCILKGLNL